MRNHCHVTRKQIGSAHWSCNINIMLTKNIPVIFHNLRGYDSHLIMQKIGKFDVKLNVIPNELDTWLSQLIIIQFFLTICNI